MFYHDRQLQYKVRVDKPNPQFAKMLQQAIGGIEGEIRVCLQYLFQSWNSRGPVKYRDMLLETGTEEISHIEMLATAVALNLEGASTAVKEAMAKSDSVVGAVIGGTDPRHILSAGLGAMAADSNGVPFNGSWVVSTGNLAADMTANVYAESTGRVLATRLYEMTDDAGMKDFLSFLIARDSMHQNQWMAVLEELGGPAAFPIPANFPRSEEFNPLEYSFVSTNVAREPAPKARWTHGKSIDGKDNFSFSYAQPLGGTPQLGDPDPAIHAAEQQYIGKETVTTDKTLLEKAADFLS